MNAMQTGLLYRTGSFKLNSWMITGAFLLSMMVCDSVPAAELQLQNGLSERLWQVLEDKDNPIVDAQERSILGATLALQQDNYEKALSLLNNPEVAQDPLANLLKAEAYRRSALKAITSAGTYAKHNKISEKQLASVDLTSDLGEATARLQAFADKVDGVLGYPLDLLLLSNDVQSVFLVDKARSRMFVYQRNTAGEMRRIADEYVVTGAKAGDKQRRGDLRTPNGIYRFTSIRRDKTLTARYGPVVFPIDYPNALDRLHGKDGGGIWMHGYAEHVCRRQPKDTNGCFALPNAHLLRMEPLVSPGKSWVIIGRNFKFSDKEERSVLLDSVQTALKAWRDDWQSLDTDAYLQHYHDKFRSGKYNLKRWKRYKKRVNRHKQFIHVQFSDLNILHDPNRWNEGEIIVADFVQHYQSSNYQDSGHKRLYLARKNKQDAWKILIEENVKP